MLLWFIAKNIGYVPPDIEFKYFLRLNTNQARAHHSIVFGYMYPAYQTFKALDGKDKEARAQLLRYWAVFAAFASVEFYTDMLISWVPFYYEIKMLILLYLSIPFTKGSATVYEMHMKPWLRAHQAEIDEAIAQARASVFAVTVSYRDRLTSWVDSGIKGFLSNKLPAMLPLYNMMTALCSETMKHIFVSPPSSPSTSLVSSAADIPAPEPELVAAPKQAEPIETVRERIEIAPVVLPQAPVEVPVATQHARAVSTPAPTISQIAKAPISKTTTNIVERPVRTRKEIVPAAEPTTRTRITSSSRKSALVGTAMPQRTSVPRPTPSTSASAPKKDFISQILEDDSIFAMSPQKRSNPKLPSSPQRRSAV